jgi:hypothetical protein
MPDKSPDFTERTFMEAGRELAKAKLTPGQLKAIVSRLSAEERPKFHQLFAELAEGTKTIPETDAETVADTKADKGQHQELSPDLQAQIEAAEKLFGTDFMGPKQYEKAFGFMPTPGQIPAIPFSIERLERARAMGQMLVLHVDKTTDGQIMTMDKMNTMQGEEERNSHVLYDTNWYSNENFHTQEAPRLSWRLVSKSIVEGSTSKNEVQQLELIVLALQNEVFANMEIPADYQAAIDEFESQKAEITKYMNSDDRWQKASEMIEALALSKLTRGTPAEMIQAIEMHHQNNGGYLFNGVYVRTLRRDSSGSLVGVGGADADGAIVYGIHPGHRDSDIGVSLSLQS